MLTSKAVLVGTYSLHGVGCSSAVRYRAGVEKVGGWSNCCSSTVSVRLFNKCLIAIYHSTRRIHYLGCLRKLLRQKSAKPMNISFMVT